MMKKVLITCLSLVALHANSAQNCVSSIPETAAESQFNLNDQLGVATDTTTGLMWARCPLGQNWNSESTQCEGSALQLTWQQALQQAYKSRFADMNDWRIPNIKELMTIVERRCAQPAFNLAVFKDATNDDFWSSTPNRRSPQEAWIIAFHNGSNTSRAKSSQPFVRLVRTAD